jgi:hypothetical protein
VEIGELMEMRWVESGEAQEMTRLTLRGPKADGRLVRAGCRSVAGNGSM